MKPVEPILVADLFPKIRIELLTLLESITEAEWHLPTVCAGWSVKDIAAHLLGDDLGLISSRIDGHFIGAQIDGWESLVAFINHHNDVWVQAMRRVSPRLICEMLKLTAPQVEAHFQTLDPFQTGITVSWIGDYPMPAWMDMAREYTERWLHQQHIREAVQRTGLTEREFLFPVLRAFVLALPRTYQPIAAPENTQITLNISGDEWHLVKKISQWELYETTHFPAACVIHMDAETAWRLFTKGIAPDDANIVYEGDIALGKPILNMVSIIA